MVFLLGSTNKIGLVTFVRSFVDISFLRRWAIVLECFLTDLLRGANRVLVSRRGSDVMFETLKMSDVTDGHSSRVLLGPP